MTVQKLSAFAGQSDGESEAGNGRWMILNSAAPLEDVSPGIKKILERTERPHVFTSFSLQGTPADIASEFDGTARGAW